MLNIKTIDQVPIFPIRLKNPLNIKGLYTQGADGYTYYTYEILNNIQDASLQKDSGLILTKDKSVQNLYSSTKRQIDSFKLNDYAYLYFEKTNYYVTFNNKQILVSHVYTTDDFIYFKIKNNKIHLIHNDLYFTVSRNYPYDITLEPKKNIDYYQQQFFTFAQEEDKIILLSNVIDGKTNKEVKRYVSYSPKTKTLRATGLHLGELQVSEYYLKLDRRVDSFYTPDFVPQSYAVEYYNNFQNINTTNTEIANKIPINNINFLVHVPYKNSASLTQENKQQFFDIEADVVALKNIMTPSYTIAKKPKPPVLLDFNPTSIFFDLDITSKYDFETNRIFINAKNIPSSIFKIGKFPTNEYRYSVLPQSYELNIPDRGGMNIKERFPAETKNKIIGIASNGVYLHNFSSTEALTSKDGKFTYNFDLVFTKLSGIDFAGGAPNKENLYKYYTGEFIFNNTWDEFLGLNNYYTFDLRHFDGHSKIIGYALDGYPIYGPYGYKIFNDNQSKVVPMRTSYRLLSSVRSQRPPLSAYPMGSFVQDYVYNPSYGDLDVYNGRFCVTPEFPNGTYAYFLTLNVATKKPEFPYILGNFFYGQTIYESASSIDPETGQPVIEPEIPIINITITVPLSNIYSCGRNSNGQLFNRTGRDGYIFTESLTGGWTKVSTGDSHTILLSGTDFYVGGNNNFGQIGLGEPRQGINRDPKLIPGKWKDVFATYNNSFAVDFDGSLFGTGDNREYQLGRSDLVKNVVNSWERIQPPQEDGSTFIKIVGGINHTLGIKSNNKLFVTGSNETGQLGLGERIKSVRQWTILPGGSEWLDIAAGHSHSIGIAADGELYSTGFNESGQTGTTTPLFPVYEWVRTTLNRPITGVDPTTGENLYSPWKKVACGNDTSYALAQNGDLFAVGSNEFGELGASVQQSFNYDWVQINGKWDDVFAGRDHVVALSNGDLYVAGSCNLGQLGLGFRGINLRSMTLVPQSTGNIVTESNNINLWQFGGGNVRTNYKSIKGPFDKSTDSIRSASTITVDQPGSGYYIIPPVIGGDLLVNETYTMSVFVKYFDIPIVKWQIPSRLPSVYLIQEGLFDLVNKRMLAGTTSRMEFYDNNWIRCITTFRTPEPPMRRGFFLQAETPGTIGIFGFQIEHGSIATPYQPTSIEEEIVSVPPPKIIWQQLAANSYTTFATASSTLTYVVTAFDI